MITSKKCELGLWRLRTPSVKQRSFLMVIELIRPMAPEGMAERQHSDRLRDSADAATQLGQATLLSEIAPKCSRRYIPFVLASEL